MNDRRPLVELLRSASAQLTVLDSILDAEYRLLERRDLGTYDVLMERKLAAVEQAGTLEANLLSELGLQPGARIHEALATAVGTVPEFADDWQRFSTLIKQCADKNAINGAIVHSKRASITKLLHILHGCGTNASVYGPNAKVSETVATVCLATV
jgi:flagellar biosynthesis/type III secretory pathway chaperone